MALVAQINALVDAIAADVKALTERKPYVQMTQAQYDAITPDPDTLYVIIG